jgi:paraquat-inducible protein B
MSAPTNHWKLGAFVVGSLVLGGAAAVLLAAQTMEVATSVNVSYFDEAVTGLEVGSPVSFRGVKIGNVSAIDVAPDRRHVEVTYLLGVNELHRLGLAGTSHGKETKISVPPDLRVQLGSNGLTGTKYIQIDFFDGSAGPPPILPFPVPENYIPATPSTMKNLEDAVVRAVDTLPVLAEQLGGIANRANALLDDVDRHQLPARTALTLNNTNRLVTTLQGKLEELQVAELSHSAVATLQGASATLARMNRLLERFDGEKGLLASVQRATDGISELAAPRLGENVEETGRDVREAAIAVRELIEALERDPDMLLKGKSGVRR